MIVKACFIHWLRQRVPSVMNFKQCYYLRRSLSTIFGCGARAPRSKTKSSDTDCLYRQSQFQIFLGKVNFECYLPAIKYWLGTCKIRGYKTLYPIRAPLCFRPHKSGAVHGRANLFLFVGTQDRWIQFQIMSILGINGGTGIPVYRKKCGETGQDGGGTGAADGSYFGIMIPDASCERRVFHASFRVISNGCKRLRCIGTQYYM